MGKAEKSFIVYLDVNDVNNVNNASYLLYIKVPFVMFIKDFFFPKKLFLLCGKQTSWEADSVNWYKLWPHCHHWTWVPSCSGFLAWAVQSRPRWLCRNHVGPHLRGYRTSRRFQLNYNSFQHWACMLSHIICPFTVCTCLHLDFYLDACNNNSDWGVFLIQCLYIHILSHSNESEESVHAGFKRSLMQESTSSRWCVVSVISMHMCLTPGCIIMTR